MPKVSLYKEGILVSEYPLHALVDLYELKLEYKERQAICHTPHYLMVKTQGLRILSQEAMEFLAGPEHSEITKAVAIFVDPDIGYFEHSKILLWMLKNIHKPKFEIEVFDNEDMALEWISNYCNENG